MDRIVAIVGQPTMISIEYWHSNGGRDIKLKAWVRGAEYIYGNSLGDLIANVAAYAAKPENTAIAAKAITDEVIGGGK
jgi:hypothetical protein